MARVLERPPAKPLPATWVPNGRRYSTTDTDDWASVAKIAGVDVKTLILFNFQTLVPEEINWYLRTRSHCTKSRDGWNWAFSSGAFIYLPVAAEKTKKPFPTTDYPDELAEANETLKKSRTVADTILTKNAKSDLAYWFAELYNIITMFEISERKVFKYPAFVMHFIPIFYDTYAEQAEKFKAGQTTGLRPLWSDHFAVCGLIVDPSQPPLYANAVTKSLTTGVTAHIKGDMAPALEEAYKSLTDKYTGVPRFDDLRPDFFELNKPIFEKVRTTLVNELTNRGMGMAAFGKSINPDFASKAADIVNMGLKIDEIYQWRGDAWDTARKNLGQ